MSTKPELSKKSPYHIPKERYYELKHFCLQAPSWEKYYDFACTFPMSSNGTKVSKKGKDISDPTEKAAIVRLYFGNRLDMIREAAEKAAGPVLSRYIYDAVTSGYTYDQMKAKFPNLPCGRSLWYDIYRKFFWLLNFSRK